MSKLIQLLKNCFIVCSLTTVFLSCDETEIDYRKPDYFPLNDQSKWEYQWQYKCDCPEEYLPESTPVPLRVTGDTVLNGKKYSKIEYEYRQDEYGLLKIVRREKDQYFRTNLSDGTEYVFLDTNIPINDFWIVAQDEFYIFKIFMRAPLQKMTVNSITYIDVIVVEENVLLTDNEFSISSFHYYAKGIGEILVYYPPTPNSYQSGSKFSLLKFK